MQNVNGLSTHQALGLARAEVEAAGCALDAAMSWLEVAPRADKVAISASLEQAFDRLRAARFELASLEGLLVEPVGMCRPTRGSWRWQ